MKKILSVLVPLLASQSALALEVGEIIPIDRSQIQCRDGKNPPPDRCRRGGYGYCDYMYGDFFTNATAQITVPVNGFTNLRATVSTCANLDLRLGTLNPVPVEVTQINTQKIAGELVMQYLTLTVGPENNRVKFQGSKQL